mmetsp:Transcript_107350/g.309000  ORF Transcript_107350/g.309000 Transcript_107350/m.309000 type:complete len:280 (-) Transcript_107350:1350-2189(-)
MEAMRLCCASFLSRTRKTTPTRNWGTQRRHPLNKQSAPDSFGDDGAKLRDVGKYSVLLQVGAIAGGDVQQVSEDLVVTDDVQMLGSRRPAPGICDQRHWLVQELLRPYSDASRVEFRQLAPTMCAHEAQGYEGDSTVTVRLRHSVHVHCVVLAVVPRIVGSVRVKASVDAEPLLRTCPLVQQAPHLDDGLGEIRKGQGFGPSVHLDAAIAVGLVVPLQHLGHSFGNGLGRRPLQHAALGKKLIVGETPLDLPQPVPVGSLRRLPDAVHAINLHVRRVGQ